ncbi:hypothetical protein QJS04_geneDACA021423 [Acorus gramineus]|uniref:DUF1995 domain-containing protein n=1 Tax=Acorus gramineus TaxID=55184 RepID=A0AAV9A6I9_ACOGR|nr:hypothetical protein QJS04_geneDACA021423 [Acorus gramineus]
MASVLTAGGGCCGHCWRRNPPSSSRPYLPPPASPFSLPIQRRQFLAFAKLQRFEGPESNVNDNGGDVVDVGGGGGGDVALVEEEEEEEDDRDLPSDLEDAIRQSSRASALFLSSGGMRAIVEFQIPQIQFLDGEGAQADLWELSRIFLETLIEETGLQSVKAVFPDAGAAALVKYQWKDAAFGFSSLTDRKPVQNDDEVVVMLVPDYQMLESVERVSNHLLNDPPRPLIMWNPRLVSEDVGVGFNVRKLRNNFLRTFTVVYSMRPLPYGAIFRCYPGMWKVFYDDKNRPNRYLLAREQPNRPDMSDIERPADGTRGHGVKSLVKVSWRVGRGPIIFGNGAENSDEEPSLLVKAMDIIPPCFPSPSNISKRPSLDISCLSMRIFSDNENQSLILLTFDHDRFVEGGEHSLISYPSLSD